VFGLGVFMVVSYAQEAVLDVFAASRIRVMVFVDVCMMKQAALVWFDGSWRWKPFWRGNIFFVFCYMRFLYLFYEQYVNFHFDFTYIPKAVMFYAHDVYFTCMTFLPSMGV
jgi:hypothetical protein